MNIVVLVNASDIFVADDGDIQIDASRGLAPKCRMHQHDSITPTGGSLVSMFRRTRLQFEQNASSIGCADGPSRLPYRPTDWGGPVHRASVTTRWNETMTDKIKDAAAQVRQALDRIIQMKTT
jgi:hypothetical protein